MKFKFNIPNKITLIRIILIPLFAIILLIGGQHKNIFAAFIFVMLSISDFLDGYFARKKRQITEFGKLIDPIADKLLISTALIFLVGKGVELWMAVTIIAREFIITAIRIYLVPSKIVVPASAFGKAKTVVQSIAIALILLNFPAINKFNLYIMLAAVLITVISGMSYIISIKRITGNGVINLPNLLTLLRFLLIFPFVYYFINLKAGIALIIFAVMTLSDKLDGISARLMNQKTELGSAFDSFTDWTLIIITLILLVIKHYINSSLVGLLIVPPIISGIMKMIYAKRQKIVPVTFVARLSVGLTYILIISILINYEYKVNFGYNFYLLMAAVILVYLSMISYVFKILSMPKKTANRNKQR